MSSTLSKSAAPAPPPLPVAPPILDIRSLSPARWKELTRANFMHVRGDNMRRLDAAVEAYLINKQSVEAMDQMRKGFRDWAAHKYQQKKKTLVYPMDFTKPVKEQLWHDEPRNARGAMTALFKLLFTPELLALEGGVSRMSAEELAAIAWWKTEIDKRAYEIFKGQRLEFRLLTPAAPKVRISEAGDYPAQMISDQLAALPAAPGMQRRMAQRRMPPSRMAQIGDTLSTAGSTLGSAVSSAGGAAVDYASAGGAGEAIGLVSNAYLLGSGIASLVKGIETAISGMAGVEDPHIAATILSAMGLPSAAEIAGKMVPFFGGAASLLKGGKELAQAVLAYRAANRIRGRQDRFREGAARQAVIGVGELLDNECKAKTKAGALHMVSGGTAIGLVFVDGGAVSGPAVTMAQLLAEILLLAAEYAEDYKHRNAVNQYLEEITTAGTLDVGVELFKRSPLLGAYYLLIAETSSVIALSLDRINHPGVLQEIEDIVRHDLPEVLEKAADLVAASHLVVPGLLSHRLHSSKTKTTRAKEAAVSAGTTVKKFFSRLASVVCFRKNLGTNPPSDPRYVGFSSTEYFAQQDAAALKPEISL
jgi:hypothetical protein